MNFDIQGTIAAMLKAAGGVFASDFPKVRACVKKALDEEADFLRDLAKARLDGVIDDDTLAQQLRDEKRTLEDTLLVCQVMSKKLAQDAANAAIDVFNNAVKLALAPLVGAARARGTAAGAVLAAKAPGKSKKKLLAEDRRLNARADTVDFRDLMYVPTLVEVGTRIPLESYKKAQVPILDQGQEGACTGFGLATVTHFLLRTRNVIPDKTEISPRMMYAMARRYDEWPGEDYEGSSCRGAMKGWHKHGVCASTLWKHDPANPDFTLTDARSQNAQRRPLGAYFRVNHKDLVAMHAAITEVGVLYASATVHSGWNAVKKDGLVTFDEKVKVLGGHAFAIVAYDDKGYWIQNSWGKSWGNGGFAHIAYEDWMQNGTDVWVARLGVPIELSGRRAATAAAFSVSSRAKAYAYDEVRPHIISLGNDGQFRPNGNIGTTPTMVRRIIHENFKERTKDWSKRRLVLYAHGGLVSEDSAVQRVGDYRKSMLEAECYPLAFVWHSDYFTTLTNMLTEALRLRKPTGVVDSLKNFMLDRLDDALEPIARKLTGKASWDEMKENALRGTTSDTGGVRFVLDEIAAFVASGEKVELHVVGHSAGAILHAALVRRLTQAAPNGLGLPIESCTLWAPACSMALFEDAYVPAIRNGSIRRFALYTLTDKAEQDDHCAHIYNKSLLYLVSNAFEARPRIPLPLLGRDGEPILGMARFVERSAVLGRLIREKKVQWALAPNQLPATDPLASTASEHGGFDDDKATVMSTLSRIRGSVAEATKAGKSFNPRPGPRSIENRRVALTTADQMGGQPSLSGAR